MKPAQVKLKVRPGLGGSFSIAGPTSERLAFAIHTLMKLGDCPAVFAEATPEANGFALSARSFLEAAEVYLASLLPKEKAAQ